MTDSLKPLWQEHADILQLKNVAQKVWQELTTKKPFALLLLGDLGAGKTALTREILYHAGLSPQRPVNSPTYTLANEYKIDQDIYVHLDLYRISEQDLAFADDLLNFDSPISGLFIEWPKSAFFATNLIKRTHQMVIETHQDKRYYSLSLFN